jgi:nucleoside-diphosphate-sugar epimerase
VQIFVAGGTGVLGRRVVAGLLDDGHVVTVLARAPAHAERARTQGARVVQGDVMDRDALHRLLSHASPDLVMHQLTDLSGGSSAANAHLRVHGSRNLVDAARAAGVESIVVQSIAWCYEPGDGPADEETPLDRESVDGARRTTVDAVIAMESAGREVPHCVVLRNGTLYGPDTWYSQNGSMADAARAGKLLGGPDVTSFVHVDDAASAAVAAIDWPSGAINVVDDEPASASVWVPEFCAAVGAAPPASVAQHQAWARGASDDRARAAGWKPKFSSWREGFLHGLGGGLESAAR